MAKSGPARLAVSLGTGRKPAGTETVTFWVVLPPTAIGVNSSDAGDKRGVGDSTVPTATGSGRPRQACRANTTGGEPRSHTFCGGSLVARALLFTWTMTSRTMATVEPEPEELIEITDDMILELEPSQARGKLLYFPPPLPRAQPLPAARTRRRRRGTYPTVPEPK
jgi:hypothetical protein